jgi:hypothetical protein
LTSSTDRLSGETPEEYVRQEIAKSLVREYRYSKADIEVEFVVRVGTRKPRADLVVFPPQAEVLWERAKPLLGTLDNRIGVFGRCYNVR